ncbi:MAG: signal peptidase I [Roseburia sp.]|nr:signal peptidase I [Roseburia sp.]
MPEQNQEVEVEKKKGTAESVLREILSWVIPFAAALVVALLLKNYVIINADVPTGSMENTIMPGNRLIGNRLSYLKDGPKRGDIVIFRYPDDEEELYVKRVIGLPGETVDIRDGHIYIDGSDAPLTEDYLKEEWTVATGDYHFQVPEDSYLMLGDNRNDSWDARYWNNTYVQREKILGKAVVIYWPLQDAGKLE